MLMLLLGKRNLRLSFVFALHFNTFFIRATLTTVPTRGSYTTILRIIFTVALQRHSRITLKDLLNLNIQA